jgi:hypothetical protein
MNFNGDDYRNVETFDVIPKNSSNVTDNNFQCSDNYIISGNNVQKIKNSTMLNCKNDCLGDPDCVGFNYGTETKECFLKKNVNSFKNSPDCTFCIKKSLSNNKCGVKDNKSNNNNSAFSELNNIFGEFDNESPVSLSPEHIKTIIESKGKAIPIELQGKISKSEIESIIRSKAASKGITNKAELEQMLRSKGIENKDELKQMMKLKGNNFKKMLKSKGIKNKEELEQMLKSKGIKNKSELRNMIKSELSDEEIEQIMRKKSGNSNDDDDESVDGEDDDSVDGEDDDDDSVDGEDDDDVDGENISAENKVKNMLQENNMLNESIQLKRMKKRMMQQRKKRTKIFIDLKCFMNDMRVLETHSDGIMVELSLLLSHIKSCAFIRKRKGKEAMRKRLQNKLKRSGHKLTKAERESLKSEIESTLSSKMKIPKPEVVELNPDDDVETFNSDNDSNYYSDTNEGENFYYDDCEDDMFNEPFSSVTIDEEENNKMSSCSIKDYSWSWDFMTILKMALLVLLLVLIFNRI